MENNFQQAFGNDSCIRCGRCCANVLMLSDHEIQVIRKYIKRHNIQVQNHNVIGMKDDANICPFKKQSISYDGDKHINEGTFCAIYPVRPSICRSYSCNPKFRQTMNYDNVKAIKYDGDIEKFLEIYSKMEYMICARFHAMILSCIARQKMFVMSYSQKIDNVIEDLKLDLPVLHFNKIKRNHMIEKRDFKTVEETRILEVIEHSKEQDKIFAENIIKKSQN